MCHSLYQRDPRNHPAHVSHWQSQWHTYDPSIERPAIAVKRLLLAAFAVLLALPALAAERIAVPRPPHFVTASEWGSKPDPIPDSRRHTPKYVTLHHAGVLWTTDRDPVTFIRNMQAWGKRRPEIEPPPRDTFWADLPYHFLIAPNGRIFEGRPLEYEPESNTKYELAGHLGVELMGNFEVQRPSPAQVESAVRVVAWLVSKYDLPLEAISTHAAVANGQTSFRAATSTATARATRGPSARGSIGCSTAKSPGLNWANRSKAGRRCSFPRR